MADVFDDTQGLDPSAQMVSPPDDGSIGQMGATSGQSIGATALADFKTSPIPAAIGFSAFRGSRTIRRGPWGTPDAKIRFRDNLDPRSWNKYKSYEHFTHENIISKRFFNTEKQTEGFIGKRLKAGGFSEKIGLVDAEGTARPVWSSKIMARASAAYSTGRGGALSETAAGNMAQYLRSTAPDLAEHLGTAIGPTINIGGVETAAGALNPAIGMPITFESSGEAAMASMMAGKGVISQRLMGAMSGRTGVMTDRLAEFGAANRAEFMAGRAWSQQALKYGEGGIKGMWKQATEKAAVRNAERTAATKTAEAAAEGGVEAAGEAALKTVGTEVGEELITKGAVSIFARMGAEWAAAQALDWFPPAAVVLNTAMTLWTAYTLAKTGATLFKDVLVKGSVREAKAGFNSFKGQLDKGPFGMGYVDNTVAATSRQRGVQAIQNSRLNARSALGSEAGLMHSHFG